MAGRFGVARHPPAPAGRPDVYPSPEEAAEYPYSPMELETVRSWTANHLIGSPETVRAGIEALAAGQRPSTS